MALPLTAVPSYRTLGKPASGGFISFIQAPVETNVSALEAEIAILGVPYGIPYEMGQSWTFDAPGYLREKSLRFRNAMGAVLQFRFWRTTAGRSGDPDCGLRGCTGRSDGSEGRSGSGH